MKGTISMNQLESVFSQAVMRSRQHVSIESLKRCLLTLIATNHSLVIAGDGKQDSVLDGTDRAVRRTARGNVEHVVLRINCLRGTTAATRESTAGSSVALRRHPCQC